MLREAYQAGARAAIKKAQAEGLLGKLTEFAEDNPSIAKGFFGEPLLGAMKTVQHVDPGAEQLQGLIARRLAAPVPSSQEPETTTNASNASGRTVPE